MVMNREETGGKENRPEDREGQSRLEKEESTNGEGRYLEY